MRADTNAYLKVMRQIKYRTNVVTELINWDINMMYRVTQAETMALQIRMILESIALASLSANKSLFEAEGSKFKEYWKADLIFRDIERKNPDFFPKPIDEIPSDIPGVENRIINLKDGFMTRDEMLEVHNRCCNFLHAPNPFAEERDYSGFLRQAPNWMNRIIKLLNSHIIGLLDDDIFYIVHMREDEKQGHPNMHLFQNLPDDFQIPLIQTQTLSQDRDECEINNDSNDNS